MKIGFIGAGNMGEAYISSLAENEIFILEKNEERAKYIVDKYSTKVVNEVVDLISNSEVIVVAVKPDVIEKVFREIETKLLASKIIISIAAGKTIEYFEALVGDDKKIVRVMPNTPAQIKKGVSGVSFNKNIVDMQEKESIIRILKATGKVIEIPEEKMDILTAISGSGPAYVFLLLNALAEGGVKLGLDKKTSLELAVETFIGAAELVKETGKHPEVLKDMVTSPGGTTAAGLFCMEENGVRKTMIKTVEETYKKAKELGK